MPSKTHKYHHFMQRAIELAHSRKGFTAPNPCVGAVLVKDGHIVAEGCHWQAGEQHAEISCLIAAQEKNIPLADTTLVVTLEPCAHHGKQPPCTEAIIAAGISRVIIGTLDPIKGGGAAYLEEHGIEVITGIEESSCLDLIDDFVTWHTSSRPYLTIKLASTLDGRIATRTGHSKWITAANTRQYVHGLRKHVDALIVGGNTFYQDDPRLTCRCPDIDPTSYKQPLAVIVTSRLPDATANLYLLQERPASTIFWTTVAAAASPKAEALRKKGIRVIGLPSKAKSSGRGYGMRAELSLTEGLEYLRQELGCYHVLCEGGGRLALSMLDNGLAGELHLHLAPKILGDNEATPLFDGRAPNLMEEALQLRLTNSYVCSPDIILTLRTTRTNPAEQTLNEENEKCLQG